MRVLELAWAALAMALIVVGAYTILLGVGERVRTVVSCGYVPQTIYEEGWARECRVDGNATICVYTPTRYATTIHVHTCVWQTYSPPTGSGLINILGGALAAIVGATILIWIATRNANR